MPTPRQSSGHAIGQAVPGQPETPDAGDASTHIIPRADKVRAKLDKLGITESDVADAVKWARRADESAE